jgi:hypothetical protein
MQNRNAMSEQIMAWVERFACKKLTACYRLNGNLVDGTGRDPLPNSTSVLVHGDIPFRWSHLASDTPAVHIDGEMH